MVKRYGRQFGVVVVLVLALALSGCGNSKKGGSYLPSPHATHHSTQILSTG